MLPSIPTNLLLFSTHATVFDCTDDQHLNTCLKRVSKVRPKHLAPIDKNNKIYCGRGQHVSVLKQYHSTEGLSEKNG